MKYEIVSNPETIQISKETVKFGDSIYQLRNITGFEVVKYPDDGERSLAWGILFCIFCSIIYIIIYTLMISLLIFLISISLSIVLIICRMLSTDHIQQYGLRLKLDSEKSYYFLSKDKKFLDDIVSAIYDLMEGDIDRITINWPVKLIKVHKMKE